MEIAVGVSIRHSIGLKIFVANREIPFPALAWLWIAERAAHVEAITAAVQSRARVFRAVAGVKITSAGRNVGYRKSERRITACNIRVVGEVVHNIEIEDQTVVAADGD